MPTYLAPGVYVEETSFRAKAIEGVPTAVTAFVGATLAAPVAPGDHPPITSFVQFEHVYGGRGDVAAGGLTRANHLAHAAHAFFAGGGRRLYVAPTAPGATAQDCVAALAGLDALPDIELVAAPGPLFEAGATRAEMARLLLEHVSSRPRRFALIDPPSGLTPAEVRAFRAPYDSTRAALYYPWILAADPNGGGGSIALPPSGFVAAAFARNDVQRGLHTAPANIPVIGAIGLETTLRKSDQDALAPLGVNVLRAHPGGGVRVWGARTLGSDPEAKYVSVRRMLAYIEASMDQGLQWTVFEANEPPLWARVVQGLSDFLYRLWRDGALLGDKPEAAFFVRCDRSTMSQADLDAGRLVCVVGVALIRPAEFVIIRVQTLTATATG